MLTSRSHKQCLQMMETEVLLFQAGSSQLVVAKDQLDKDHDKKMPPSGVQNLLKRIQINLCSVISCFQRFPLTNFSQQFFQSNNLANGLFT